VSAFVHAPKLAGVLFAIIPFTFIIFTVLGIWADSASQAADKLDGKASSLIEQILSSVRIVQAFNINEKLLLKLENEMLRPLRRLSQRKSAVKSIELAAAFGAGFLVYAVSFWYGGISISEGTEVGNVLTVRLLSWLGCPAEGWTDDIGILQLCQPILHLCRRRPALSRCLAGYPRYRQSAPTDRAGSAHRRARYLWSDSCKRRYMGVVL
jgi:ABC-type multidrug transport system fused ATPase/permease subunit